ncbi:LysM peptidoglycan-binding domain-containing protein [Macrococcoides goetzii]|nr:LysM peptidoglycan-binding domain-containing protein [Macrococcus goetzii]TDM47744.1 LysM peptidoglycan-binding domain-containing protein [Macrococcus goetzii]
MALEPIGKTVIQVGLDDTKVTDGLTKLNAKMKMADNVWKSSLSTFKQSDRSIEKLGVSLKGMNDKLKVQQTIVAAHEKKVEKLAAEYGNAHTKVIKATAELEKQRATMGNLQRSVGEVTKELQDLQKAEQLSKSPWAQRQKELQAYSDKMSALGERAMGMGQNMSMAVTAPIVGLGAASVKVAGEYSAAESQFKTVFGNMQKEAKASLDAISKETGLLPNSLRGTYTQMAAFAKTTGASTKDAMNLTSRATLAAADSAAFYDRSISEVSENLQSFLKGNYENDAALGISATETTRNAKANEIYGKSFVELSEQQKQLTLLKMVEDGNKLAGAMGQAAREQDQLGTQTSNLKTAWADFQNEVGKPLLPIAIDALKGLSSTAKDAANWFNGLGDGSKKLVLGIGGIAAAAGPSLIALGMMANGVSAVAGAYSKLSAPLKLFTKSGREASTIFKVGAKSVDIFKAGLGKLPTVFGLARKAVGGLTTGFKLLRLAVVTNPFGAILLGVTALGAGLVWLYKHNEKFRNAVNNMAKGTKKIFGDMINWAKDIGAKFGAGFGKAVDSVKKFGADVGKKFNEVKLNGVKKFQEMKSGIVKWTEETGKNLSSKWSSIRKTTSSHTESIRRSAVNKYDELKKGTIKALGMTASGLSKRWSDIKKTTSSLTEGIRKTTVKKYEDLKSGTVKWLGVASTQMSSKWGSIKKNTTSLAEGVRKVAVDKFEQMYKKTTEWVNKIGTFISGAKAGISRKAGDLGKGVANAAIGGLNAMISGINSIAKGITGKGSLISKIPTLSTGSGIKKDTLAIVGDKGPGNGPGGFTREIIKRKDGSMHLTPAKDTLVYLGKEDEVINGRTTYDMMKRGEIPRYSKGTKLGQDAEKKKKPSAAEVAGKFLGKMAGTTINNATSLVDSDNTLKAVKKTAEVGDKVKDFSEEVMEYMDNPGKLVDLVVGPLKSKFVGIGGATGDIALGAFNNIKSKLVKTVEGWFSEFVGEGSGDGSSFTSFRITTPYSPNARPPGYPHPAHHYGIDYATPQGHPITAPSSGMLTHFLDSRGGLTGILTDKIFTQFFMHMESLRKDGPIKKGAFLGKTGGDPRVQPNSGIWSNGPHLHYQVKRNDGNSSWNTSTVNPATFLNNVGYGKGGGDTGGGSQSNWKPTVIKALSLSGLPTTAGYVNAWLRQIQTESGGRPTVIGGDDGLADGKAMGLVQVKPGTFRANALPGHGNILNPLDNLIAGMRYAKVRYGGRMLGVIGQGHGYANGGIITKRHFAEVGEEGPEAIIPLDPKRKTRANHLLSYANSIINKDGRKYVKEPPKTHTVKSGDTLWGISQANKMTVSMLKELNNLKSNLIFPKQILKLNNGAYKLVGAIKEHASTLKKSITKKPTTVKSKVQMTSVTGVISKFADGLIRSGTIFKDLKTSKTDLSFGKFLETKLKGLNSSNIKTVMTNVSDIKKKLTEIDKKNDKLIKTNNTKIKSATVKNFDEQLKIDNYKAEKALNGKKGTITVKTRIAARDTTLIDRNLAKSKLNKAAHEKDLKTLHAYEDKLLKKRATLKTKKEKENNAKLLASTKKRIADEQKQRDKEVANIKKYEAQRADALKLKYKTEKKYVTGRSASALDKLINTSTNNIGKNNTLIKNLKSENALYAKQSATLNKIKGAEILKSDVLKKIAARREQLVKMMEALKKKETSLKEEKQGFADSISENLQSYAGFGGARGHTARDFVSWMRYRLGKMRTFASNVQKLKGMGLDPKLIREMLAGGIENAIPKVEALVKGGGGYISQINSLQKEIDGVVKSISTEQSTSLFADELASNKRRQDVVTKAMKDNEARLDKFRSGKDKVISMKSYTDLENKTSKYKYQAKPLPKKTTTKKSTTTATSGKYKVKSGDSLWLIANKYKTTVDNLKKLNGLKSNLIHPNQTLKVPGVAKSQKVVNLEAAKKKREDESTKLIVNTAKKLNVVGKNDKYAAQLQKEIADIRKTTTKKDDALVAKLEKEMKENKALTKEMVNLLSQILNKPTNVILDGQKVSKTVEKNIVTKAKTTARKTVTPKPKTAVRRKA